MLYSFVFMLSGDQRPVTDLSRKLNKAVSPLLSPSFWNRVGESAVTLSRTNERRNERPCSFLSLLFSLSLSFCLCIRPIFSPFSSILSQCGTYRRTPPFLFLLSFWMRPKFSFKFFFFVFLPRVSLARWPLSHTHKHTHLFIVESWKTAAAGSDFFLLTGNKRRGLVPNSLEPFATSSPCLV